MTFNFENSKKLALSKKDKSTIQGIDEKIKKIVEISYRTGASSAVFGNF